VNTDSLVGEAPLFLDAPQVMLICIQVMIHYLKAINEILFLYWDLENFEPSKGNKYI
jgi:hypothetical protein